MNKKSKKAASKRVSQKNEASSSLLPLDIAKSMLVTLGLGGAFLLLLSLFAYFQKDPDSWTLPLGILASALTAFCGGIAAVRIHGHSALICGLLNGAVLLAIMMLLSLFFVDHASGHSALISALLHAGVPILSVLGAYLGLPKAKAPRRKKLN